MIILSPSRATTRILALAALVLGSIAALFYVQLDLTLSHYDARGHLVVARRIFDSLTPGWRQIGAVWLPLPHVMNAVPVQFDPFYRTGASAIAISIASFASATAAIGWIVAAVTQSRAAAFTAASIFALNPNVLYLQATPMTEPLLLGLMLCGVAMLVSSCRDGRPGPFAVGIVFALACLTRYEAWPATAAALCLAVWVRRHGGEPWSRAFTRVARIGVIPAAAILGFLAFSKLVVGEWFVSSGFFVPDNPARGRPLAVAESIVRGVDHVTGHGLFIAAAIGLVAALVIVLARRTHPWMILPSALVAPAALPFAAFLAGHPYRIRYMVPLIAAGAVGAGLFAGLGRRGRTARIALVVLIAALELRPLSPTAPMVVEAQWDHADALGRARVTACLEAQYDGRLILASMGSLGHYMQELSHIGIRIRNFVHEGTGEAWQHALVEPAPGIGWILLSEGTDERDALAGPTRDNPALLRGFSRICEGGRVALYRRDGPAAGLRNAR